MKTTHLNTRLTAFGLLAAALVGLFLMPATTTMGAKPVDADGDGYTASGGDCNDSDPGVYPGAPEICGDGVDNDCDGTVDEDCGGGVVDTDGDGFADATEAAGILLPSGLVLAETGSPLVPRCTATSDDALCVDPGRPDLFVIIKRLSPSRIPSPPYLDDSQDPLAILRGFVNAAGLPVVPHELAQVSNNAPRLIADGQNAVIVNERADATFGPLGFAPTGGTPNTTDGEVDLYPVRIGNEVLKLCSQVTICDRTGCAVYPVTKCQSGDGSVIGVSGLQNLYMQNVLAHETWHVGSLAPADSAAVILYHFDPSTGWVMEQSIGSKGTKDKSGNVTVTLYISETFNTESRSKYKLK